jgi:hypothetical protein
MTGVNTLVTGRPASVALGQTELAAVAKQELDAGVHGYV